MFRSILKFTNGLARRSLTAKVGPIATEILEVLSKALNPVHIEVVDHSNGSESHFRVTVVSDKFENLSLIQSHRLVTDLIKTKLDSGAVHALSIETIPSKHWKKNKH